jgi:uncharacterized protein
MNATPSDRITSLDVIRGIAVMGIFSVNVIDFALIQQAYLNPAAAGWHGPADIALWLANHIFIDEKMRTLFSILFGASSLLVIERAIAAGRSAAKAHYARIFVLLAIGLIHFYLIWLGDILIQYSGAALLAFFLIRRPVKVMLWWAGALLTLQAAMFSAGAASMYVTQARVEQGTATAKELKRWEGMKRMSVPDRAKAAEATATMRSAWPERTARRFAKEKFNPIGNTMSFMAETIGLMLLGAIALRTGFFDGSWPRRRYVRMAVAGIGVGIAFSLATGLSLITLGFPPWLLLGANYGFGAPFHIAMAAGYAALIMLALRPTGWLTARIAATGRAAFTNYIGTSIIASLIFYGDGLALFGHLSRFEAWAVAVPAVWLAMLAWSKPWLDHFHYGPLEWLWRSLARGAPQPMRKAPAAVLRAA